ncbi:MAG: fumarylacetoacetate hydrolase family protein [Candidatus Marinimicrobia bacterium]|nr:fumarylacetoacetate hydrolase family protein [Candidatus Neomarinimicrobiota bacterium]
MTTTIQSTRIFCIGRNYLDHVNELSNQRPAEPVIFMKPPTCLVKPGLPIQFPKHGQELQHEVEVVVQIGTAGYVKSVEEAKTFIAAITIGLDLTLRDVQSGLKQKGLPWEKAKAFENSAPIGDLLPYNDQIDLETISFGCRVNGQERQVGNTGNMLFSIPEILLAISTIWKFEIGDLIYTGTPAGVGSLNTGDEIEIYSDLTDSFSWRITD